MKHTLTFHLIRLSKKIQNAIGFKSQPISLSYSQANALVIIASQNPVSQSDIAQMLHLKPASVVTLIDELERLKLVKRKTNLANRRKYQITLTEKGLDKANIIKNQTQKLELFLKNNLTKQELETFTSIIERLTDQVENWQPNSKISREEVKHELPGTKQSVAS